MPARRRVLTGRQIFLTLAAAAGVALTALPASAAPVPTSPEEATQLIAGRAHDLEVLTERFNDARVELTAQQAAAAQAADQVTAAQATVATARDQVREVARSAFTGDQLGTLQAMLTSGSAGELLDRVGTLGTIADHNNGILGAAQAATDAANEAKAAADKAAADAQAQVDQVAAQQAALQSQIAGYQADYDRLTAEQQQQARLLAEQHASVVQIDRSAPAASRADRAPAPAAAPTATATASAVAVASSGAGRAAVNSAMAQIGDPYVWAAAGPDAFDCSGLTQFAYAAAGIALPHSSSAQAGMGQAVSRDQLQPGDLIGFYSPVSHIGIYIGNGQMVHAPTSGDVVK
ncbi:MAG: Cell wall-associated hydrolase, invasion-associated protein, partial [Modestobacter sp.]|nr:Cell wall-associated hydrolase, invasion-associated protein [Modestobacter sp.]